VDEIDLHMHPKWQRQIQGYLTERFPNTQFIVTAHSPLIVQAAADSGANIAVLNRVDNPDGDDYVEIINDPDIIKGWRVDQIMTSDLFGLESVRPPSMDKPLAERKEILAKKKLTKKDQVRLEEIETEVGELPTAETKEDQEAMDIIRRAAKHLKDQENIDL
jgi:predicted ATP-binding protein involved in virulence